MNHFIRSWKLCVALLATSCIVACGGGGDSDGDGMSDTSGAVTFSKSYGSAARDAAAAALPRPGGGYVFVGSVGSLGAGYGRISPWDDGYHSEVWVTALDQFGDIQWQRSYGRLNSDPTQIWDRKYLRLRAALDVEADGQRNGVWLVGRGKLPGNGEPGTDLLVTRLDALNRVLFSRTYDSGPFPQIPYGFIDEQTSEGIGAADIWPTADGGALVAADAVATVTSGSEPTIRGAIFLIRISAEGEPQWSKVIALDNAWGERWQLHVREAPGGAVVAYNLGEGMEVIRVDAPGTVRWRRTYTSREFPQDLLSADENADGVIDSIVVAGIDTTHVLSSDQVDGFVIKLDVEGNQQWRKDVGRSVYGIHAFCRPPAPCRYIASGSGGSGGSVNGQWVGLLRVLDRDDGDTVAEHEFDSFQLFYSLRYAAAADAYQLVAMNAAGKVFLLDVGAAAFDLRGTRAVSDLADGESTLLSSAALPFRPAIVPDVGDGFIALAGEQTRNLVVSLQRNGATSQLLDQHDSAQDNGFAVQAAAGGDIVIAGDTDAAGGRTAFVMRLNSTGGIIWQHRLNGLTMNELYWYREWEARVADLLRASADGGFVIGGSSSEHEDARLLKLNADGAIAWTTRSLAPSRSRLRAVRSTVTGWLVAGDDSVTHKERAFRSQAWVAALDASGTVLWQRRYSGPTGPDTGSPRHDDLAGIGLRATDLSVTADGGALLVGPSDLWPAPNRYADAAVVVRLDAQGGVMWANTYPLGQTEVQPIVRIAPAGDDGFVIAASVQDGVENPSLRGRFNLLLFKISASGAVEWSQQYGGRYDEVVHGIERTPDGGYIISARSDSLGERSEAWVLRVGADGKITDGCNADLGRAAVVARPLMVTHESYELDTDPQAAAPLTVTQLPTDFIMREPRDIAVARQCFGTAGNNPGPAPSGRTLTVRQAGSLNGVVTSTPSGIVCGTQGGGVCASRYAEGSLVSLRVDIGSVQNFTAWGPGCESVSGAFGEVCSVRMTSDTNIDVNFSNSPPPPPPPVGEYRLTVTVDRLGAFVGSTDGSFACTASGAQPINTCVVSYPVGRVLDLYAQPLPGTGILFEAWDRDCASFGSQPQIRITMNQHYNCRAIFVTAP